MEQIINEQNAHTLTATQQVRKCPLIQDIYHATLKENNEKTHEYVFGVNFLRYLKNK